MKIVLITDTHFGARSDNTVILDYFDKFFEDVFFPYIKNNDIDYVCHLGDVFDKRKIISSFKIRSRTKEVG
jgi:DNA repair exonuclease SbcCD nuclease subunit